MQKNSKIFIAGHNGLVGSALVQELHKQGFNNLLLRSRKELDLTNQIAVESFFLKEKPEYVFLAAAKVGGIYANSTYPAEFIYSNIQIQTNVINASWKESVKKLLFLGSSCIYPRDCQQPMQEISLLSGPLEPSNKAYAIAKIAGIIMCQSYNQQYGTSYISVMPTNLYGPNDNYHLNNSHVLPALIRRFHEAKMNNTPKVTLWGTGNATREFLFSNDLANACILLMEKYSENEIINIGSGVEVSIYNLALAVKEATGYKGSIDFDTTKPDGMPRKLLDCSKIKTLGWEPVTKLEEGIKSTYNNFVSLLEEGLCNPNMVNAHRF